MTEIIATLITGVAAVLAVVLTNVASNKQVQHKMDKLEKHDKEQWMQILKLSVMNPDLPIEERLIAGKKYLDEGGNGSIREYYEKMKEEHTR